MVISETNETYSETDEDKLCENVTDDWQVLSSDLMMTFPDRLWTVRDSTKAGILIDVFQNVIEFVNRDEVHALSDSFPIKFQNHR